MDERGIAIEDDVSVTHEIKWPDITDAERRHAWSKRSINLWKQLNSKCL